MSEQEAGQEPQSSPKILKIDDSGPEPTVLVDTGHIGTPLIGGLGHHETMEVSDFASQRHASQGCLSTDSLPHFDSTRFRVDSVLGRGGMSVVHSVYDQMLERSLAMKVIAPRMMESEASLERFIFEAQVMSSLQHPSIIPVHDIGKTEDGAVYFMMDAVDGESMRANIDKLHQHSEPMRWAHGEWSLHRLIDGFYRVCETIGYVHEKNVAHLDIKPLNIQFGRRGEVWVLDWGLARRAGGMDYNIWCTAQYTAPERTIGHQTLACDVYALGCVLFEILVGVPPFYRRAPTEIFADLGLAKIPKISAQRRHQRPIPDALLALCERAMAYEANERPSIDQLTTAVREWLDGSQRKEKAQALITQAVAYKDESVRRAKESQDLMKKVALLQKNLPKEQPLEAKYPLWDLEHKAKEAREHSEHLYEEQLLLLKQAVFLFENAFEASIPLIEHCIAQHRIASQQKRTARAHSFKREAERYMALIPAQHPAYLRAVNYFKGTSTFSLVVPEDSSMILESFADSRKRLQAKVLDIIECSGEFETELPVGSYRVRILNAGHQEVQYPFFLEHGQDWSATFEPSTSPKPLALPEDGELETDACYVPESWCYCSGDAEAPNALAEARVWVDGFIISRTPITHRQYLSFINDALNADGEESASRWVPREQSSQDGELGSPVYTLKDGQFTYPKGPAFYDHPVVQVSWYSALAYTQWLSQKTGKPWRLPMELEWEKAARGVDRRFFPWGDAFDSGFCVMMDSHSGEPEIKAVYHQSLDVSVYGVMSCAGNTREWCLDRFSAESLPIRDGKLLYPSTEDLRSAGFRSSRGGSFGNAAARTRSADRDWWFPQLSYIGRGFRIARSWPPTEASEALQERIAGAHQAYVKEAAAE